MWGSFVALWSMAINLIHQSDQSEHSHPDAQASGVSHNDKIDGMPTSSSMASFCSRPSPIGAPTCMRLSWSGHLERRLGSRNLAPSLKCIESQNLYFGFSDGTDAIIMACRTSIDPATPALLAPRSLPWSGVRFLECHWAIHLPGCC